MKTFFNQIVVSGLMMKMELERMPDVPLESFLKSVKELTERVLKWETCPKCKREVPSIDMTVHGFCFYCFKEKEECKSN